MSIEEGEEVQVKGIHNIFNKIMAEKFPSLKKEMPIQVQEASRTPNQNRTSPWQIIVKTTSTVNKERILIAVREKNQITYTGKSIKRTSDFSTETLKARTAWSKIF
jgi:hypothetical protein